MSEIAVKVENLSKLYQIGTQKSGSLRETLVSKWHHLTGKKNGFSEDFWALKDVSFEIKQGEAVGIIGRNGAGKSTLLKILSRITEPSKGRIEINGRVASLLEVGTGFHPELSGRENIYLNGTILGMTRREVKAKFDEIVDFSGVEKFIDTPVKYYSSGMYVRLAFAVAAHLEPEILIIDEVLAVGDAEFQKKCLGKMGEVAGQGRTVLFVSHNMAAVKNLCQRALLIRKGILIKNDSVKKTVDFYLQNFEKATAEFIISPPKDKSTPGYATKIIIENKTGQSTKSLPLGDPFQVRIIIELWEKIPHFIVGLGFLTSDDFAIRTVWSKPRDMEPGLYEVVFREENVCLASGRYKLVVGLSSREQTFHYVDETAYCDFEAYVDKTVAIRSNSVGIIINQMSVTITELQGA